VIPVSTSTKLLSSIAALAFAVAARADLAVVPRGPLYADSKGVALKAPEGVGCSSTALVVADTGNGRLVSFDWKDGAVSGGTELKPPQLTYPVRVQVDAKGNMLVLDRKAKRIARLDPKGSFQGWLDPKGAAGVVPVAFKLDSSDNVYLVDVAGSVVLQLDPSGAVARKLEIPKGAIFTDVTVDAAGTLYAVDAAGGLVWSVEKGGAAFKQLSKPLMEMMSFPGYITTDGKGALFIVDQNGSGLVLLGIDGSYLGRRLAIGWADGTVYYPSQICLTEGGEMVLADRGNNRVQTFSVTR
jgi:sugar lactone lactonase YvrE